MRSLRKIVVVFLSGLFINSYTVAQSQWTWVSGYSFPAGYYPDVHGIYGVKGTPSSSNRPPFRQQSLSWTDTSGNFWVFGGLTIKSSVQGLLNDLWKYDRRLNQWTWMGGENYFNASSDFGLQGLPSATNAPGSRYASIGWSDKKNNFYMFGGEGYNNARVLSGLSELWKFNSTTQQWSWVSGGESVLTTYGTKGISSASTRPGYRKEAASWVDNNGNLWMFGGYGYTTNSAGGILNDLWKYAQDKKEWVWVNGDSVYFKPAVYGIKGVASSSNHPGNRGGSANWTDKDGNLWLFGGYRYPLASNGRRYSFLNDLWKYNISTNQWTWISGDSTTDQNIDVNTLIAPLNRPSHTANPLSFSDLAGNFWLVHGEGLLKFEVWRYTPGNGQWVLASSSSDYNGRYGQLGVSAPSNIPGARILSTGAVDKYGDFWLFGGQGYATLFSGYGILNDLWKFSFCNPPTPTISASGPLAFCEGSSVTLTSGNADSYTWSTGDTTQSITVTTSGSYLVTTRNGNHCPATSEPVRVVVKPLPSPPGIIEGKSIVCEKSLQVYSVSPDTASLIYSWTLPSGWSGNSATNIIHVAAGTEGGLITVNTANDCGNSFSGSSLHVSVNPLVSPAVSISETSCTGTSITFTAAAVNAGPAPAYRWSIIGNGTSTDYNSPTFILNDATNGTGVFCEITSNAECVTSRSAVSNMIIIDCINLAAERIPDLAEFIMFPTPATAKLYVQMKLVSPNDVQFILTNSVGMRVYQSPLYNFLGSVTKEIPVNNLPTGVYYLQTRIHTRVITRKVMVMRY